MSYEKETQISEEKALQIEELYRRYISHLSSLGINTAEKLSSLTPEKRKGIEDNFVNMEKERREREFYAYFDAAWEKIKPTTTSDFSLNQIEAARKFNQDQL